MFESAIEDNLSIPEFDEAAIDRFGEFVKEQMRHQYRMGKIQAYKEMQDEKIAKDAKYGR